MIVYKFNNRFANLQREKPMKKSHFILMLSMTLLFSGCGGGGGSDTDNTTTLNKDRTSQQYEGSIALWDYLVPASDTTNSYIKTTATQSQTYQTRYLTESDSVTEISELSQNEKTVYTNNGNEILITFYTDNVSNGSVELKAKVDIGDIVTVKKSDCRLTQHLNSFVYNNQTFTDVIEIKCGDAPGYYQKGVGEVVQERVLSTQSIETKVLTK